MVLRTAPGQCPNTTSAARADVGQVQATVVAMRSNQPPVADAGPMQVVAQGEAALLDGSGSYGPDGEIVLYEWDLDGDGEFEQTGRTVEAVLASAGEHVVILQVTDDDGATATDSTVVQVLAAPTSHPAEWES